MTKAVTTIVTVILVLLALGAVAPRIAQVVGALVPLVLVSGIVAVVLRAIWFYTR
ncbi:MAG: hypothetical protein WB998_12815 [Solirubrobacteraceae bacterium]